MWTDAISHLGQDNMIPMMMEANFKGKGWLVRILSALLFSFPAD